MGAAGILGLTILLYFVSTHSSPASSDGASVVLEGKSLLSGNIALKHWSLSLDSFWLVEAPVYAVFVAVIGITPKLLFLVPAFLGACVVAVGAWIASRGQRGWSTFVAAATVVVLLGLPTSSLSEWFLRGPYHVGTVLWCLLAFVGLRRGRFGWGFVAATALLAAAVMSDLQAISLGVGPVALAGAVLMAQRRSWRAGTPAVAAAGGSLLLAIAGRRLARSVGTFGIGRADPTASFHQVIINVVHVATLGSALFGVGGLPLTSGLSPPVLTAHAVGLAVCIAAVVLVAVVTALWAVKGKCPRLAAPSCVDEAVGFNAGEQLWFVDVLTLAFIGGCGTFGWLASDSDASFARYLTASVIFAAILGGCIAGRAMDYVAGARFSLRTCRVVAVGALLVVAGYGWNVADTIQQPTPMQPASELAAYLYAHHLTKGIGDYWTASITTVQSSGKVVVRPVSAYFGLELKRYTRLSTSDWYTGTFQFLAYDSVFPWENVDIASAIYSFGRPSHIEQVGIYQVLTWPHPLTILGNGDFAPQPWAPKSTP